MLNRALSVVGGLCVAVLFLAVPQAPLTSPAQAQNADGKPADKKPLKPAPAKAPGKAEDPY